MEPEVTPEALAKIDELMAAGETLDWLEDRLKATGEESAAMACMQIVAARLELSVLAMNLTTGMSIDDAIRSLARGDTIIAE